MASVIIGARKKEGGEEVADMRVPPSGERRGGRRAAMGLQWLGRVGS